MVTRGWNDHGWQSNGRGPDTGNAVKKLLVSNQSEADRVLTGEARGGEGEREGLGGFDLIMQEI